METYYVHQFLNKQLQDLQYTASKHCGSQEEVTSYSMLHQNNRDFWRMSREGSSRLSGKVHLVCVRQAYWTTHTQTHVDASDSRTQSDFDNNREWGQKMTVDKLACHATSITG
jgi:hypothetical protein